MEFQSARKGFSDDPCGAPPLLPKEIRAGKPAVRERKATADEAQWATDTRRQAGRQAQDEDD